jgi:hypothetical protein
MTGMTTNYYASFDPLLDADGARAMVELCRRYGTYKMYSEEPTFAGMLGEGLPARYDAVRNFLKTGGRFGAQEPIETLAARTNYFRESYAYGDDVRISGIEPFLHHEGFHRAARELYGKPVVVPAIVYANLLVPGQELAVHTDVPEFRGANRTKHPQWLLVVMHHSGLFREWRMPIATGVAWFHDCEGGEFAFYPDGPARAPVALQVRFNTAVLLDTDTVFHGVDRVAEKSGPIKSFMPGMKLRAGEGGRWQVIDGERVVDEYAWRDLRFSISWKAYCFTDERERDAWRAHGDDLNVEVAVSRLLADLRERGKVGRSAPSDHELIELLIDEYVAYPQPQPPADAACRKDLLS